MTADDPTNGELKLMLSALNKAVTGLTGEVHGLRQQMEATYVRQDLYARDQESHSRSHRGQYERLERLESARDWVLRIVLAVVIVAVLGLVIKTTGTLGLGG